MRIRKFLENDREHCLAVFDCNAPEAYGPEDRSAFAAYLDQRPEHFWVVEEQWRIVGCGGVRVDPDGRTARLCWGMVRRDHQREGWGSYLLGAILSWAHRQSGLERVVVRALPVNRPFFERFGFEPAEEGQGETGQDAGRIVLVRPVDSPGPDA